MNANAYTGNLYLSYPACFLRTMLPNFNGTQYAACYVVGTLNGSVFTPVEPLLTSAIPTEEDGYTYLALGLLCTLYQLMLIPEHALYRFVDGAFKPLSQIGYEAYTEVGNLRTETETAIEQTNAAIALKADATTVSNLEQRVESAEQKVTPEAITSAVTSSALYAYEKYAGRKYCLNSDNTHTFVDNKYRYAQLCVRLYLQRPDRQLLQRTERPHERHELRQRKRGKNAGRTGACL